MRRGGADARLTELADEVDRTHERVHATRNGREYVVLLSTKDLESLEATIELLSDAAALERVAGPAADRGGLAALALLSRSR